MSRTCASAGADEDWCGPSEFLLHLQQFLAIKKMMMTVMDGKQIDSIATFVPNPRSPFS